MSTYKYLVENEYTMATRKGGAIVVENNQVENNVEKEIIDISFAGLQEEANSSAMLSFDFNDSFAVAANDTIVVAAPAVADAGIIDSEHVVLTVASTNSLEETADAKSVAEDSKFLFSLYDNESAIKGGTGNDTLVVIGGNNQVLVGGTGSDTYKVFSGLTNGINITIDQSTAGADDKDRLQLSQVSKNDVTFIKEGKNLTIKHSDGGEIEIKNWSNHELEKISFSDGVLKKEDIEKVLVDNTADVTGVDVLKVFMGSLNNTTKTGFAAVDEAVSACSAGLYENLTDLVGSFVEACTNYSGNTTEEKKSFLLNYCGINLDNDDTGAISGLDAGGATTKTATSVVNEGATTLNDFVYDRSQYDIINTYDNSGRALGTSSTVAKTDCYSTNINGVKFYWNESNWDSIPVNTSVLEQIMGGFINSWAESAMNLIEESYGISLNESDSKLRNYKYTSGEKAMQVALYYDKNSSTVAQVWSSTGTSNSKTIYATEVLCINVSYFENSLTDVDGTSSKCNVGSLDRVIAHEMVHGVMAANVNSYSKLPTFIKEGLAELVHGIDDTRTSNLLQLTNTDYSGYFSVDGTTTKFNQTDLLNAVLDCTNTNTTVGTNTYAAGYMLLRYMAQQVTEYMNANDECYSSNMLAGISTDTTSTASSLSTVTSAMLSFGDASISDSLSIANNEASNDVIVFSAA